MKQNASNVLTIKQHNRALVFSCLRRQPTSRVDIARLTGLSRSAVTNITTRMMEEGYLTEIGIASSQIGRKPILLDIVPERGFSVGIWVTRQTVTVCLCDLKEIPFAKAVTDTAGYSSADELINDAWKTAVRLMENTGKLPAHCIGIGVGAPGPLNYKTGEILNPPRFPLMHGAKVKQMLEALSHLPVMVDNDTVLLAMRENAIGKNNYRGYLMILANNGIGSAIMENGQLYRGSNGFTGEIGHTGIDMNGTLCACGKRGCLETYLSEQALRERFGIPDYHAIVDAAEQGDERAQQALQFVADCFSYAIANTLYLLDLDAVVMHGDFNYKPKELFALMQERIRQSYSDSHNRPIEVVASAVAQEDRFASATAAIMDAYFDQRL